jgi:hypothetical protein
VRGPKESKKERKGKRTRRWGQDDGERARKDQVGRDYMERRKETSIIL